MVTSVTQTSARCQHTHSSNTQTRGFSARSVPPTPMIAYVVTRTIIVFPRRSATYLRLNSVSESDRGDTYTKRVCKCRRRRDKICS
jgi:hypothetical protein